MDDDNKIHETKVIYHIDDETTPYLVKIFLPSSHVTLKDFKMVLNKQNFNYKYFFKSMDADFGVVKEEIADDSTILPCFNGKVVSWLVTADGSNKSDNCSEIQHSEFESRAGTNLRHLSSNMPINPLTYQSASVVSSDLDSTSLFETESEITLDGDTTEYSSVQNLQVRKKPQRRKKRAPSMSRTSSYSSITDSTMSLNIITVQINMDMVNFLGISIVGQSNRGGDGGIYVGSIMKGGAVALDGRIEPGDMILQVNDVNFENMTNDEAVRVLREVVEKPGPIKLVVAKCWDPNPKGYFTIPRTEPVRPIDPGAWVAHTSALRSHDSICTDIPESVRDRLHVDMDMKDIVREMTKPESTLEIRDRNWLKITIPNAFIGADVVHWIMENVDGIDDRREARKYASAMLNRGYIKHTVNKLSFSEQCYYVIGSGFRQDFSTISLNDTESMISDIAPLPNPPIYMPYADPTELHLNKMSDLNLNLPKTGSISGKTLMSSSDGKTSKLPSLPSKSYSGSGSATGNPRNKVALKPGHSLMDWIRLGNSGVDLTGTGGRVRPVSSAELAQHNTLEDAWLAIRGKVYNITKYMDFHPGGVDELMKGAGKDATKLFDEVHAWVNYEQLLSKCFIGPLRNTVMLNLNDKSKSLLPPPPPSFNLPKRPVEKPSPSKSISTVSVISTSSEESVNMNSSIIPRFDWIQKTGEVTLIFYTKMLCNPGLIVELVDNITINIRLIIDSNNIHTYKFILLKAVNWPFTVKASIETGKMEVICSKQVSDLWTSYGKMTSEKLMSYDFKMNEYIVATRTSINHDTSLLLLQPKNNNLIQLTPIGYHISVSANLNGEDVTRSYTPIPASYCVTDCPSTCIPLLVKCYPDGQLSKHITRPAPLATALHLSQPNGNFLLSKLKHHNRIALLAAGSGITPILAVLNYLVERSNNRMEFIHLLYFNKTESDIWCQESLDSLNRKSQRVTVTHILSDEENKDWNGEKGRISPEIIKRLTSLESPSHVTYACVCGPKPFNELCTKYLQDAGYNMSHLHCFQG